MPCAAAPTDRPRRLRAHTLPCRRICAACDFNAGHFGPAVRQRTRGRAVVQLARECLRAPSQLSQSRAARGCTEGRPIVSTTIARRADAFDPRRRDQSRSSTSRSTVVLPWPFICPAQLYGAPSHRFSDGTAHSPSTLSFAAATSSRAPREQGRRRGRGAAELRESRGSPRRCTAIDEHTCRGRCVRRRRRRDFAGRAVIL